MDKRLFFGSVMWGRRHDGGVHVPPRRVKAWVVDDGVAGGMIWLGQRNVVKCHGI